MLELSHASEIAELWETIELKAELPCAPEDFSASLDPSPRTNIGSSIGTTCAVRR